MRNTQGKRTQSRSLHFRIVMAAAFLAGLVYLPPNSRAQQDRQLQGGIREVYIFEAGFSLPIEISAIRHLQERHWASRLEIDVRNISQIPVYGVNIGLSFPGVKDTQGRTLSCELGFGQLHFLNSQEPLQPDYPHLDPGQTVTLRLQSGNARGIENYIASNSISQGDLARVHMVVLGVNLGHGKGYVNGGVPFPNPANQTAPSHWTKVALPLTSPIRLGKSSSDM